MSQTWSAAGRAASIRGGRRRDRPRSLPATRTLGLGVIAVTLALAYGIWYAAAFINVLTHGYDLIDHRIVWSTIDEEVPVLLGEVEALLK